MAMTEQLAEAATTKQRSGAWESTSEERLFQL
jgi:hypothetical protein